MNLPNKISVARICMIPVFVLFFFLDAIPYNHVIAAVIFALAALTDLLDGHIARSRNLVTNLGKFLDPIADKVLVATAFILIFSGFSAIGATRQARSVSALFWLGSSSSAPFVRLRRRRAWCLPRKSWVNTRPLSRTVVFSCFYWRWIFRARRGASSILRDFYCSPLRRFSPFGRGYRTSSKIGPC